MEGDVILAALIIGVAIGAFVAAPCVWLGQQAVAWLRKEVRSWTSSG